MILDRRGKVKRFEKRATVALSAAVHWHDKWNGKKVPGELLFTSEALVLSLAEKDVIFPLPLIDNWAIESESDNMMTIQFKDLRVLVFSLLLSEQKAQVVQLLKGYSKILFVELPLVKSKARSNDSGGWLVYNPVLEYERMGIPDQSWQISAFNADYAYCDTYPTLLVVPKALDNNQLIAACKERSRGRLPVLVWKSKASEATISRCSQPLMGLSIRDLKDDLVLVKAIQKTNDKKKLVVVDARPRANAIANSALGGGYENYSKAKLLFMNIANIHVVRESFTKLRDEVVSSAFKRLEDPTYCSSDAVDGWLEHVRSILCGAVKITRLISTGHSVLVHCSDGWDRTPQLTSTASILLDPAYRTLKGFEILIEKEWCSFGHKFAERNGLSFQGKVDQQEKCPIFLQWLDTVYQLLYQFPNHFEFNENLLIFLIDELYSCNYGTFLFDSEKMRIYDMKLNKMTKSIWSYVNDKAKVHKFLNPFFDRKVKIEYPVLFPRTDRSSLVFWGSYYVRYWSIPYYSYSFVKAQFPNRDEVLLTKQNELKEMNVSLKKQIAELKRKLGEEVKEEEEDELVDIYKPSFAERVPALFPPPPRPQEPIPFGINSFEIISGDITPSLTDSPSIATRKPFKSESSRPPSDMPPPPTYLPPPSYMPPPVYPPPAGNLPLPPSDMPPPPSDLPPPPLAAPSSESIKKPLPLLPNSKPLPNPRNQTPLPSFLPPPSDIPSTPQPPSDLPPPPSFSPPPPSGLPPPPGPPPPSGLPPPPGPPSDFPPSAPISNSSKK